MTVPWRPAAADATGLLHHADDEFVRLLPEEWPGWTGPYLPDPLRQASSCRRIGVRNKAPLAAVVNELE